MQQLSSYEWLLSAGVVATLLFLWVLYRRYRTVPTSYDLGVIWSASPGLHERHLRRRVGNLLFPSERRFVTQREVDEARQRDDRERTELRNAARAMLEPIRILQSQTDLETALSLLQSLEQLWRRAVADGSETLTWIPLIDEAQRTLAEAIKASLSDDPEALSRFQRAEELRTAVRARLSNPVVLDLQSVPPEDFVYSVVTESPEKMVIFLAALAESSEAVDLLRVHGTKALAQAVTEGYPPDEAAFKMKVLMGHT